MAIRRWVEHRAAPEVAQKIADELGIGNLSARVLASRGFQDPVSARAFLECEGMDLDPYHRKDMEKAVSRIRQAIREDEKIAIYGDYDADGLTATTLMYRCLCGLGGDVLCSLPSREGSGYGLSDEVIDQFAERGVSLIVTVDNGISAFEEAEYASQRGIDMVITDHHVAREELPLACAVVNPHRLDDTSEFKEIAGVGVALELAAALEEISVEETVEEYGVLASIGTIGDIMPLRGENRYIVSKGIERFAGTDIVGLRALCDTVGISVENIDETNIAYTIAPRLNAAGRMGDAVLALSLLLTEDEEEAASLAAKLEEMNKQRQEVEAEAVKFVQNYLCTHPDSIAGPVILVAGEDFHSGIMGIVCSRLVDIFDKPSIVISVDGDIAKGSGRSVSGFSLFEMIDSCSDLMEKYGGHDMAAGFTLKTENIPELKRRLFEYCKSHAGRFKLPEVNIDGEVKISELEVSEVAKLRCLAPFGGGNKEPTFVIRNAMLTGIYPLGERHTRISIRQGDQQVYAAHFGVCPQSFPYKTGDMVDVVVNLSIYHSPNRDYVSLRIVAISRTNVTWQDIDSYEEYRRYSFAGGATAPESLRCSREDAAIVYRKLRQGDIQLFWEGALAGMLGQLNLGQIMVLIRVFVELGFVELKPEGRAPLLRIIPDAPKRELNESPTFRDIAKKKE
ncbi:MAG: single-stranded-DNA-specific exonuclease RecJ [Oscillospiraceae bacterium]|nr:single-stranded-DNA-specific exonuclease RecJ [Oscillospiraceae bacterium]